MCPLPGDVLDGLGLYWGRNTKLHWRQSGQLLQDENGKTCLKLKLVDFSGCWFNNKITVDNCTVVELENGSWTNWIRLYFSTSSPVKSYQIYQCCVFSPGHDLILSSFKMIGASVEWSIIICLWLKHRLWLLWKLWHVQKRLSLKDIDASCIISIFVDLQISHIIREIRQFQQTAYKIDYQPKVRLVIMWTSLQSLI